MWKPHSQATNRQTGSALIDDETMWMQTDLLTLVEKFVVESARATERIKAARGKNSDAHARVPEERSIYIYNWHLSHRFERRDFLLHLLLNNARPPLLFYITRGDCLRLSDVLIRFVLISKKKKKPSTTLVTTTVLYYTWGLLETKRRVIRFVLIRKKKRKKIRNESWLPASCFNAPRHYCFILHVGIVRDYWAVCNTILPHSEKKKKKVWNKVDWAYHRSVSYGPWRSFSPSLLLFFFPPPTPHPHHFFFPMLKMWCSQSPKII